MFGVLAGADLIGSRNIINTKTELRRLNRLNSSSIAEMLRHDSVVALIAEYWSRLIGHSCYDSVDSQAESQLESAVKFCF